MFGLTLIRDVRSLSLSKDIGAITPMRVGNPDNGSYGVDDDAV